MNKNETSGGQNAKGKRERYSELVYSTQIIIIISTQWKEHPVTSKHLMQLFDLLHPHSIHPFNSTALESNHTSFYLQRWYWAYWAGAQPKTFWFCLLFFSASIVFLCSAMHPAAVLYIYCHTNIDLDWSAVIFPPVP